MPHSNHDSAGSSDTFDLTGPMTTTAHYLNDAGVGRAISPNNQIPQQPSSLQSNAWKRRSLPNTGVYAEYIDRSDLDELLALHAARNNRIPQNHNHSNQSAGKRTSFHEDQQLSAMAVAKERAQRESPIIAELRTNVIVKDEFTLVTDLSRHLAQRYARSDSAIMVKVDHSACIALGGTFDPCYIMTVTNIASQMGPAMNKRNAALIQSFMSDILSVPADRGIVQFHAIAEQDLAINGTTIQGEIERQEKQHIENGGISTRRFSNANGRQALPSMKKGNMKLDTTTTTNRNSALYPHENLSNGSLNHRTSANTSPSPTVTITPANAFDRPIPEAGPVSPTTSHLNSPTRGENGLRMHPVTSSDIPNLRDSRLPNGRPKTISADTSLSQREQQPVRLASLPQRQSFSTTTSSRPLQSPSFLNSDPTIRRSSQQAGTSATTQSAPNSRHSNSHPDDGGSGFRKPRESYYGSSLDPPKPVPRRVGTESSLSSKSGSAGALPQQHQHQQRDSLGNGAGNVKRRSTITATPRLPMSPPPPPVPESPSRTAAADKASSAKSLKVGKRKSFLSAFRRSAATSTA